MEGAWTYAVAAAVALPTIAACWLALLLTASRRRHRAAIDERGKLLQRERASAARTAVDAERARIARELHDIVSHNVSLMVVQAAAARDVLATMPAEADTALKAVETAGRATMTELRLLLGVLAPAQDGHDPPLSDADLSPSPGLSRLDALINRFTFAGLPTEVRVLGRPRPLPAGVDATAYRIVQEALTNALKHAPGAQADVTLRYADRNLRVEILNTGPSVLTTPPPPPADPTDPTPPHQPEPRANSNNTVPASPNAAALGSSPNGTVHGAKAEPVPWAPGTGRGLLGLRERVALYGGDLDARRRLGGGYRVRARIPLDRSPTQDTSTSNPPSPKPISAPPPPPPKPIPTSPPPPPGPIPIPPPSLSELNRSPTGPCPELSPSPTPTSPELNPSPTNHPGLDQAALHNRALSHEAHPPPTETSTKMPSEPQMRGPS